MGGKGSSSKRKSSKRKRDKNSSKKRSQRKESKKSRPIHDSASSYSNDDSEHSLFSSKSDHRKRLNKNKKRHRDYSVSSYSDYQSMSSDSDSLSTHDTGSKRRKVRQSRIGSKSTKKGTRKRSISPKGNADAHKVRKRKRLDRDHVLKPIKKSSKKKPKKYVSSDSESCSTCQSRSSDSSEDGKHRRSKIILDKEIERREESYKAHKKYKVRSPSVTGRGKSVSVSNSDRALSPVTNSRRLRSVIAVVDQPHDKGDNRWERDPQKEEIVYDQNDYPSPKSVDSNEGGSKMESDNHSCDASIKRISVQNVAGGEVTDLSKSRIDGNDQNNGSGRWSEGALVNNFEEKETDVSLPVVALGGDVLESILRQKALENLKKFQGRLQTGPRNTDLKMNNETDVNLSSAGRADIILNKSNKQDGSNAREMDQTSVISPKRDLSQSTEVKKLPDGEHVEKESGMAEQTFDHPANGAALLGCSEEVKLISSSHAVLATPVLGNDNSPGTGATNVCSSSTAEQSSSANLISEKHSLEQEAEAKNGSQFEQKTMSVMRGGEMVQVSYKVYIPKKAPALARRQLRR